MSIAPVEKARRHFSAAWLLPLACLAASSFADVTADPSVLVFHNIEQAETVTLTVDEQPLSAHALTGWRLMVEERNYSHMLHVTPTDKGLRITPSDTVEVGSYTLVLATPRGNAAVQVFTPLTDHQAGIEALAQRMNISMDEVRKQAGFTQRLGRDQITLGLLPVYYLGQRIQLAMPGAEGRAFTWKVNGQTVQEGSGTHYFEYVAEEVGPLLVAYEEREKDALVASAATLAEVALEPAIPHKVNIGTRMHFEAPPGFAKHVWLLDNAQVGADAELEHTFVDPGNYTVKVLLKDPTAPGPYAFRETRYAVTVTPD